MANCSGGRSKACEIAAELKINKLKRLFLMKRILLNAIFLIVYFLLSYCSLYSISIYPYSYKVIEKQNKGSQYIIFQKESEINYLLQDPSSGCPEQIHSWSGLEKSNSISTIISDGITLSSFICDSLLCILKSQSDGYFCYVLKPNLKIISKIRLDYDAVFSFKSNIKWAKESGDCCLYLLFDRTLFYIDIKSGAEAEILEKNVVDFLPLQNKKSYVYLTGSDFAVDMYLSQKSGEEKFLARLLFSGEAMLKKAGNHFAVLTSISNEDLTVIEIIDKDKGIISLSDIAAKPHFVQIDDQDPALKIFFLSKSDEEYCLNILNLKDINNAGNWIQTETPKDLVEPLCIKLIDEDIFLFFRNGIITINKKGKIESVDYIAIAEIMSQDFTPFYSENLLLLSSSAGSILLQKESNNFWFLNRFYEQLGKILIPLILLIIILIIHQLYKHQKRLLNAVLNLPTTGICLVLDKQNKLINANQKAKELLNIGDNIPFNRAVDYYCAAPHLEPLKDLCRKANMLRSSFNQRVSLIQDEEAMEWYCNVTSLSSFFGKYRGFVLTGIDLTEELERKRINNWAQFAHELQTNLSVLRLNSEMLQLEESEDNLERKKRIIKQIKIVTNKVRDIVHVGRSDKLEVQKTSPAEIIEELKNEFDLSIYENLEFQFQIVHFFFDCDKQKLTRALRNAVENSIRAIKNVKRKGIITFKSWEDGRFAHFAIQDNGEGMSDETKKKNLRPYFTEYKKQGGAGIGTMIMQRVMEMHGGRLSISSELDKGTETVFSLPLKQ